MTEQGLAEDWYVRSCCRAETHYGQFCGGEVTTRCGLTFKPEVDLFGGSVAVAVLPMQAGQSCPDCRKIADFTLNEVEEPAPGTPGYQGASNAVRGTWVQRSRPRPRPDSKVAADIITPPVSAPVALVLAPLPLTSPVVTPTPAGARDGTAAPAGQDHDAPSRPSRWYARTKAPGDTHWVLTTVRGTRNTACKLAFQAKRRQQADDPDEAQRCPECDAARPLE